MKPIKVQIQGKLFPLRVEEEDEPLMHQIARLVDDRIEVFRRELVGQPEQTILIMAALSIAEELQQERRARTQKKDIDTRKLEQAAAVVEKLTRDIRAEISDIEPR